MRELLAEPGQKDGAPLFRGFQNGRFSGKAVLTTKSGSPLLSCLERGNGSRVYYVHSPLQSLSSLDKQNVMAHLSENLPLRMTAQLSPAMIAENIRPPCFGTGHWFPLLTAKW